MKTIAILRHAKSVPADPQLDDFERTLNDRGRENARLVGRELKRRGKRFDLVLASAAVRVRETLDCLAEGYGESLDARFDSELYETSVDQLIERIQDVPDDAPALLIVGHNPVLQRLVVELTDDDPQGRRRRIVDDFPTCAVAFVTTAAPSWREIRKGGGEVSELILPGELGD